jgi:regulator of RNase E activity RraA
MLDRLDHYTTLRTAGTSIIADVFDSLHLEPPVLDNRIRFVGAVVPFAGPAYTITGVAVQYEGGDRAKLAAIDAMPSGAIAVWAGMDASGVCCFGDLLATSMRARGCIAAVVDGGVRDTKFLENCGMPVMSRYRTPAQGVGRWRVSAAEVPVQIRGALSAWVTVDSGDIVVGDADGIIAVPKTLLTEVVSKVRAWSSTEAEAREAIATGMPLLQALMKFGHL